MKIYKPTSKSPYKIPSRPITLRVACTAGINRSAVVREYLKTIIDPDSVVFPQHGIKRGDYGNKKITCQYTIKPDGFEKLFGCHKLDSIQVKIFSQLGYKRKKHLERQTLKNKDKAKYKAALIDNYWKFDEKYHNVFVLINKSSKIMKLTIKRLRDLNVQVDLVILKLTDSIHHTGNKSIEPNSKQAYKLFVDKIKKLIN